MSGQRPHLTKCDIYQREETVERTAPVSSVDGFDTRKPREREDAPRRVCAKANRAALTRDRKSDGCNEQGGRDLPVPRCNRAAGELNGNQSQRRIEEDGGAPGQRPQ